MNYFFTDMIAYFFILDFDLCLKALDMKLITNYLVNRLNFHEISIKYFFECSLFSNFVSSNVKLHNRWPLFTGYFYALMIHICFMFESSPGGYLVFEPNIKSFWEGHKILQNLHRRIDGDYIWQICGGDFTKFCGLLRIYEL